MKRFFGLILVIILMGGLVPAQAASKRPPKLVLLVMQPGEVSQAVPGEGTWESEHEDVATVTPDGIITALSEGFTLVLLRNKKGDVSVRCEVKVGEKAVPPEIEQAIDTAIAEWAAADGNAFARFNKYTEWYNPAAYKGFGWCGAFVGYAIDAAGIQMDKEFKAKSAPPIEDGRLFAVRQASQTKLFEGFESRNRLSHIPERGYYIIYGRKGSTPYTHVGLVTQVSPLGDGQYILETVEGNLNNRIKRYSYLYDSLAERQERNIKPLPPELQTQPDVFNYKYVENFYLNVFGQTWY
ncbi:MAG: CHAP domain-containing protein [Clostridiales bacterium]|nr:CHAP domain-containing protein [Clostridiales bacterium]